MKLSLAILVFLLRINLFAQELDLPDPRDVQNLEQEATQEKKTASSDDTQDDVSGKQEGIISRSDQGENILKVECTCPQQAQQEQPQATESLFPEGSNILISPVPVNPVEQEPRKIELVYPQFKEPSGYSAESYKQMPGMSE